MSRTLITRILSGIVLAPLIAALIVWGKWTFLGMAAVAAVISLHEWYGLARASQRPGRCLDIGGLYLTLCFGSYVFLRFGFAQGGFLALAAILTVWASDTGAYFSGRKIGGPRLAPRISPNKTWAGFIGAVLSGGLMLLVLGMLAPVFAQWLPAYLGRQPYHRGALFATGLLIGAVGQAGDLFVSIFKRKSGLKDTGALIPGHGGLLDRIDSLLLVAPVFLVLLLIWRA